MGSSALFFKKKKTRLFFNSCEKQNTQANNLLHNKDTFYITACLFERRVLHTYIYILNKVCRKYAEGMQCKSLTLSAYLVLQQLSLFQTARPYFTKCIKTLNTFVETFYSPDIFGLTSSFFLSCVFWKRKESFPE